MMRLLAKTLAAMALLGGFTSLRAEFGYVPVNWMTTSSWRKVMFKMVAPQWEGKRSDGVIARQPFGVAYEINADGELKELWRTQGWHCPQAFISDDGRYLVRMGEPATDKENHTDLAVAFYDRGVLLKEYRVCDLLKDASKLGEPTRSSYYYWRPEKQSEETGFARETGIRGPRENSPPLLFHLVIIDKTDYRFDVATGKVFYTTIDKRARSSDEIYQEEKKAEEAEAKAGLELYAASSFKKEYEAHFALEHLMAIDHWNRDVSGVDSEGKTIWVASLTPRKNYALRSTVDVVFPVGKGGKIETSITPTEIDAALEVILAHPYVKRCIADGELSASWLSLAISGDLLQDHSADLRAHMAKVLPESPVTVEALRPWAEVSLYCGLDAPTSPVFFLNVKTGQMIVEDRSKRPYEHYLIDAKGVRVGKQRGL